MEDGRSRTGTGAGGDGAAHAPPIAFMHVAKTAGTSVVAALETAFAGQPIVRGFDRSLFGAFNGWDGFDAGPRRAVFLTADALPHPAALVVGHLSRATIEAAYPGARLMTVLREPITRLLSHWVFWRQVPARDLEGWGAWTDRVRLAERSLDDFLQQPGVAAQTDNQLTRQLLWPDPLIPADAFIDRRHDPRLLRLAAARLRRFSFVDLVEQDGLAARLSRFVGRPCPLGRVNAADSMPERLRTALDRELTEAAWSRLRACSRLDARLWAALAARRLGRHAVETLRERTIAAAIARYGAILRP